MRGGFVAVACAGVGLLCRSRSGMHAVGVVLPFCCTRDSPQEGVRRRMRRSSVEGEMFHEETIEDERRE